MDGTSAGSYVGRIRLDGAMSLTVGPAFSIAGYTTPAEPDFDTEVEAVVHAADDLVAHSYFWCFFLAGPLGAGRESDSAFDYTAADFENVQAVLGDTERWPTISLSLGGDAWMRIVFRNFEGDMGLDYVEERPGRPAKVFDVVQDQGVSPWTWPQVLAVAELPDPRLTWAQRFILMLPILDPQELPADAGDILHRALDGIGAGDRPALVAELVDSLDWRAH